MQQICELWENHTNKLPKYFECTCRYFNIPIMSIDKRSGQQNNILNKVQKCI